MSSNKNTTITMGQPSSFYGVILEQLRELMQYMADARAIGARHEYYDRIREKSGLPFDNYGDDPNKWIAWMEANDTTDKQAAWKLRDERRQQRGLPPLPHY